MSLPLAAICNLGWPTYLTASANHLWQSTLFAGAIGLLTLLLRKNHARTRHLLWLIASVKFLIPFSLFVTIGAHLGWSNAHPTVQPEFLLFMQDFGQPFVAASVHHTPSAADSFFALTAHMLPALLLLVWFCGLAAVLFYWWTRLRRISSVVREAKLLESGREFDLLRRLEHEAGMSARVDLLLSDSSFEPGILGIFRPVLLFPSGISDRLTDVQLQTVLTHELFHVRRRDNLVAAFHMFVEALFWFHPLIWWLGARLIDERERACDEGVLRLGSNPQAYAESILKICEFYLESPLVCAAGVTGSNLKKRIEAIMQNRAPLSLNFARKLVLSSAGFLAVAIPVVIGLLHATQTRAQPQGSPSNSTAFASIYIEPNTTGEPMDGFAISGHGYAFQFKTDRFLATNVTLKQLIRVAYQAQDTQISNAPDWLDSDKYDVVAVLSPSELEKLARLNTEQRSNEMHSLIQALLADRFKLDIRRESKSIPVYALVVPPNGPKLQLAKPGDTYPNGIKLPNGKPIVPGLLVPKPGEVVAQGVAISALVSLLAGEGFGRPVFDKTGLTGDYDFILHWTADPSRSAANAGLFSALEEQLGLRLEPQSDPVEVLAIAKAEKPVTQAVATLRPAPAQASPSTPSPSSNKTVLSDLRLDGDFASKDTLREKLLKAWQNKEYDDPDKLIEEIAFSIRSDFQEHGYFKVVVDPIRSEPLPSSPGPKRLAVIASVKEGVQYRLGTFSVRSAQPQAALAIPSETLRDQFHLLSGELFNVEEVKEGLRRTNGLYRAKGYSDAAVMPSMAIDEAHHVINVTIRVDEKPKNT